MKKSRHQFTIRFGYLGHYFYGLQPQPGRPSVGQEVYDRITLAAGQRPHALQFAARTDRGVDAWCNIATCWFKDPFDDTGFSSRLIGSSDKQLICSDAKRVAFDVHARANSRGKRYRYAVEDCCTEQTQRNAFAWQIAPEIDADRLRIAASYLIGEHDFSSFRAARCGASSPIKTISEIAICGPFELSDGRRHWQLEISGTAFLRKMVRNIMGTLIEIGTGLRSPHEINEILNTKSREVAGVTAPPHALTLVEVYFEDGC